MLQPGRNMCNWTGYPIISICQPFQHSADMIVVLTDYSDQISPVSLQPLLPPIIQTHSFL